MARCKAASAGTSIKWIMVSLVWAGLAAAQTRVDLGRQAKSVDLSVIGPTKPVQVGTILPSTCETGQMFFKSNAAPGSNLHACVSADTWLVVAAGSGSGGVSNSNFSVPGNLPAYLDNTGVVLVDSGVSGSPAVLMTQVQYQQGTGLDCVGQSTDSGSTMTCLLSPTLNAYTLRMPLRFTPHVTNVGAFTLEIDVNGAKDVKGPDCVTDPTPGYFRPGQTYALIYDGASFCEVHSGGMTAAAPYLQLGLDKYLPFGFRSVLPPTSGWTGVNFGGASLTVSGMGGAVQIDTPSSRSGESLNLQTQPRSGTNTLIAVIAGTGSGDASVYGACGVGVYESTAAKAYVLMQQMRSSLTPVVEAGYTSATAQSFAGNQVIAGVGSILYLKVEISGANVITSYSATGGAGSWKAINTRALGSTGMPASVDKWVWFGEPGGATSISCQLLSWELQ